MRLKQTYKNESGSRVAKVYHNPEWEEHVVKFYKDGKHQTRADHHSDKEDAHSTAKAWVDQPIKESIVTNLVSKNLVEANKIFKEQMAVIAKKKLLEHKKMIAAQLDEGEVVQFPQRKKQPRPDNDQISKPKSDNYDEKNPIHSWHNSRVLAGDGETATSTNAYESYLNFCNDHGHEPKSMFPFVKEWMEYSGHPMQKQNGRAVHVVKIQDPPELKEAPELKIVPPKKRTASDFADGMSDYSKSGAGIKTKQGVPQGNLKVVKK